MFDFEGKHMIITGAAAGIGFGIAKCFHDAGARVSIGDFRPDALDAAIGQLSPERSWGYTVDVRLEEQVDSFFHEAEQKFGPVDIVVANAGVIPSASVVDMTVENWDRVMETNARGTFLTCRAGARSMLANETAGKIITIASIAADAARVSASHYCASKAAIVQFTKSLALEMSHHRINVNIIKPGYVEVESEVSPLSEEYKEITRQGIPLGRPGRPEDIGNMALFLASDYADHITGESFVVAGGASAGRANLPPAQP
jgi:NAD(P)-dependent dehydrogenase (short-subunit alcohol dehydrogenase family)